VASGITGKKVQSIKETEAGIVASGCPGCRLQICGNLGENSIETLHPVELVARALP
jgi:Fe-S oxidoreductase